MPPRRPAPAAPGVPPELPSRKDSKKVTAPVSPLYTRINKPGTESTGNDNVSPYLLAEEMDTWFDNPAGAWNI